MLFSKSTLLFAVVAVTAPFVAAVASPSNNGGPGEQAPAPYGAQPPPNPYGDKPPVPAPYAPAPAPYGSTETTTPAPYAPYGSSSTSTTTTTTTTTSTSTTSSSTTSSSPTPSPAGNCNTGNLHCCNSLQDSKSDTVANIFDLFGAGPLIAGSNAQVGFACSPVVADATAGDVSCTQQAACCEDSHFNGAFAVGCMAL